MKTKERRRILTLRDLSVEERRALREEIREAAARDNHLAIAATISERIELDIPVRDLGALVLEEGSYELGDIVEWELEPGLTAYVLVDGMDTITDQVTRAKVIPTPRRVDCSPEVYIPDVRAGKIDPLGFAAKTANAFARQKNYFVWSLLTAAVAAGDANYTSIAGATLTQAALNTAISTVQDKAGMAAAIVGRSTTINAIADFSGYSDETKREIEVGGVLGTYRGATIVGLQQMLDEYGLRKVGTTNLISPLTVMVVGQGVGKYRSSPIEPLVHPVDKSWHQVYQYTRWDIGAVLHPNYLYRLQLTG